MLSSNSAKTGRFGVIASVESGQDKMVIERIGEMVSSHVRDLAKDGRDFLIRTRRTMADAESVGAMFVEAKRWKVIIWIALENYEQSQIGEHTFLPLPDSMRWPFSSIEWFSRIDTYTDDEENEQPFAVSIAKVGDMWFEEGFIMEFNRQTYVRIEVPKANTTKVI